MNKLVLLSLLLSGSLYSQEMVQNGDFEINSGCPDYPDQLSLADYWSSYGGSPDYLHVCSDTWLVQVPGNVMGNQEPYSGNSYAGFIAFGTHSREFVGNELIAPLTIGTSYKIEFKVNLARNMRDPFGNSIACSHIGARLSTISYDNENHPAIDNFSHILNETIITDSTDWVTISGTVFADSAYQYLIIGNFYEEDNFDTISYSDGTSQYSYYFLEDVSIEKTQDVGLTKEQITYTVKYDSQNSQAIITCNQEMDQSIESIQVYTTTGQLVSKLNVPNSNQAMINCSTFSSGIYILQIVNPSNQYDQLKFVVH